jgi:hypothetical protein
MIFFPGLDDVYNAKHFPRCFVSVNRLRTRKSDFAVKDWILDSGAFTELFKHGHYRHSVEEYAAHVLRWARCGNMLAAVAQDYMCEPFILAKTGLTVEMHQRLTLQRYDDLLALVGCSVYILPVLQGYEPREYIEHLRMYGDRLAVDQWVGVGSVCKRNARVEEIEQVLMAIHLERPDLRLHGFGVKTTALASSVVRDCLDTADSMAWSRAARYEWRNAHDWREAEAFADRIAGQEVEKREFQTRMMF